MKKTLSILAALVLFAFAVNTAQAACTWTKTYDRNVATWTATCVANSNGTTSGAYNFGGAIVQKMTVTQAVESPAVWNLTILDADSQDILQGMGMSLTTAAKTITLAPRIATTIQAGGVLVRGNLTPTVYTINSGGTVTIKFYGRIP